MGRVRGGPVGGKSEMGHGRGQIITRSISVLKSGLVWS